MEFLNALRPWLALGLIFPTSIPSALPKRRRSWVGNPDPEEGAGLVPVPDVFIDTSDCDGNCLEVGAEEDLERG